MRTVYHAGDLPASGRKKRHEEGAAKEISLWRSVACLRLANVYIAGKKSTFDPTASLA
jgi:hypothetical protein